MFEAGAPVEEVRALLGGALERHPDEPALWFQLATSHLGEPETVVELVDAGLEKAPEDPWTLYRAAAVLFFVAEDVQRAADYLARAQPGMDDEDFALGAAVLGLAGRINHRRGNLKMAEKQLRLLVDAEPEDPRHSAALAWVLFEQERYADARRVIDAALRHAPGDEELRTLSRVRRGQPLPEVKFRLG